MSVPNIVGCTVSKSSVVWMPLARKAFEVEMLSLVEGGLETVELFLEAFRCRLGRLDLFKAVLAVIGLNSLTVTTSQGSVQVRLALEEARAGFIAPVNYPLISLRL
jgi:hypothetical protein